MILLSSASLWDNIEAIFAVVVLIGLLILGTIYSMQNAKRTVFYSI